MSQSAPGPPVFVTPAQNSGAATPVNRQLNMSDVADDRFAMFDSKIVHNFEEMNHAVHHQVLLSRSPSSPKPGAFSPTLRGETSSEEIKPKTLFHGA